MLNIKPVFGNKKPETIKKDMEDLKEKIKDLNAETIKEQLGNEMEEMLSIGVGDVVWQAAKKGLKRFIPIYGWISIPGDIAEAKEFLKLVDIYEAKFKELADKLPQYPKKLKELAEAINSGDTAKASRELADVQADYGLVNKCIRARKCLLVPYSDTKSGCKSPSSAKDCSKGQPKPTREQKKQRGCCKGQTGHHLMPDSYFTKKGKRGVADKGICKGYSECDAPTVCVEGAGHSHGSHGKLHDATDKAAKKAAKDNPTFGYKQARDACIDAHKATFPLSFCKEDCLKEQLDAYYDCACEDNRGCFGDD
jgi:NTP pyrophosphatase (non-canonical NTP hydrolase)